MTRRRLVAAMLVLTAAGALYLQWRPLRIPTRQAMAEAVVPLRADGHAVLLLLPEIRSGDQDSRALSAEWTNLLEQRFGGCDVAPLGSLGASGKELLRGRMLVVFPRAAIAALDSSHAPLLDQSVRDGAHVLLEMPDGFWSRRLGLPATGSEWRDLLPWPKEARDARRRESMVLDPPPLPIRHHVQIYWPRMGEVGLARAQTSPAGRAAIWSLDLGAGRWLVLGMDFAELASRLRQGAADADGRLRNRHPELLGERRTTADLVTTPSLLQSDHAWLDRWLDALLPLDLGRGPWARMWPASFEADGFLVMLHEAAQPDSNASWASEASAEFGLGSTFLLAAPGGSGIPASSANLEHGLLGFWPGAESWRDARAPRRRFGVGAFRPLGRLPGIRAQWDSLRSFGGATIPVHRMESSVWSERPDAAFAALVAAGLETDLSFGPDGSSGGWLFGSSMPFRPLSQDGRVHRILELPVMALLGQTPLDGARLRRWLRQNAVMGHGPITLDLPVGSLEARPSRELFELWQRLPAFAAAAGHQVLDAGGLAHFWRSRNSLRLASDWNGEWVEIEIAPSRGIPAQQPTSAALALPQLWQGRTLVEWEADWPSPRARQVQSYGEAEMLFELPWSGGRLRARYAGP